jgi:hypothetical protein
MNNSGNSFMDKTSDFSIKLSIDESLSQLKLSKNYYEAVFPDGQTTDFEKYEEAISFLTLNPQCKLYVKK